MSYYAVIEIDKIKALSGSREIHPDFTSLMSDRLKAGSKPAAIDVIERDGTFEQISGQHRLSAKLKAGQTTIEARVFSPDEFADDDAIAMATIEENLIRRELTVLEKAVDIARWKAIFERQNGAPKRGRKRAVEDDEEKSAKFALNFSEAAQRALDISRRSVFLYLKVASIEPAVRVAIALHKIAKNQTDLLLIADQSPVMQGTIAELLTTPDGETMSCQAALDHITGAPSAAKTEPWQTLSNGFAKLPPTAQARFLDAHADAVLAWVAERKGKRS